MTRALVVALVAVFAPAALTQTADAPVDNTEVVRVSIDDTGRVGISVAAGPEAGKLLVFGNGSTSNTAVSVNGASFVLNAAAPTTPTAVAGKGDGKTWTTVWDIPARKVTITQELTLVRGAQTGKLDTVLVKYVLKNTDKKKQKLGVRAMIDTLIGRNDGVPFAVPERADLVTTGAVLAAKTKNLPDSIQALEKADLRDPGTVAHLGVRVSPHHGVVELPDSVVLSGWPGGDAPWSYPISPMGGDSAVGLYWAEALVDAGGERVVGYTYGLAKLFSSGSGGEIALTAAGSFKAGEAVTVTAYLDKRVKQPTATIELDEGMKLAAGQKAKQTATIRPTDPYGRLSWKVVCGKAGEYKATVRLSNGLSEEMPIVVR